jgi:Flp pilus assembly protein TadD
LKPDEALLPWLHGSYGFLLQADGDLDGAISEFREMIRLQPENPDAHYRLGSVLYGKGDQLFPMAVAELREALRLKPDFAEARLALGKLLTSQCMHEKAALLVSMPPDVAAAGDVSTLPFRTCEQAVGESRKAVNLKANWAEAHHQLAHALWWDTDRSREEALSEYAAACSLEPSHPKFCKDYQYYQGVRESKRSGRR